MQTITNHNRSLNRVVKETIMRKRSTWKGALMGLAALVAVTGWTSAARASQCGDLNNDSKVTIADALLLLQAQNGVPGTYCGGAGASQCGDMNADGGVGIGDVVILLNFLAGNQTLFPICTGSGNPISCTGPGGASAVATDGISAWAHSTTVQGNLTQNQIWPAGCRVNIDGLVFVQPGVTITMNAGALVVGKDPPTTGDNTSALVFLRGSKINAPGTQANPIHMTSSDHLDGGAGHIGDWGGLTINGKAPVNCPGGECLAEGLTGVPFGGTNPHDSSGVVHFLRLEFSGKELTPDNELNCITLNGVGDGTTWDHTQTNVCFDDCHEWFGGTMNAKFLVSTACGDDCFDTQLGWTGKLQYGVSAQYQPYMQNLGNNGLEWDDNENGFTLAPVNAPQFCNITSIGTALQATHDTGLGSTDAVAFFRRGTAGTVANWIAEQFETRGIEFRDNATSAHACDSSSTLHTPTTGNPALLLTGVMLYKNGFKNDGGVTADGKQIHSGTGGNLFSSPCNADQYWAALVAAGKKVDPVDPTQMGTDPGITVKYGRENLFADAYTDLSQFIPSPPAAQVTSLAVDCHAIDPFFDTTGYLGAFQPGQPTWLSTPWISLELQ
jgi:hypothetical protein